MSEIINALIMLTIVSCGLSVMISPLTGKKIDPFLIGRPFWNYGKKIPGRLFRSVSNFNLKGARNLWKQARRSRWLIGILLGILATILGVTGFLLAVPAEILGAGSKKKP